MSDENGTGTPRRGGDRSPAAAFSDSTELTLAELRDQQHADSRMLRGVPLDNVWGLFEHCEIRLLAPGETLLEREAPNSTLFMVLSGRLSVRLESAEAAPVAYLNPGETVGEMSVIDGSSASAFVVADSFTRLLSIDSDVFWRLVRSSHEFAVNLLLLLAERVRSNNTTIAKSARLQAQFEHAAMTDGLTGLNNRRWLDETLPRLVRRYQRNGRVISVMMIDVDLFKRFNDDYGHAAGDRVLVAVGRQIAECLRPLDLSARYGGEEFIVILPDADMDGAGIAGERLRERIRRTSISQPGMELPPVTVSIGIAMVRPMEEAGDVVKRADAALYRAKENGRDRVEKAE